MENSTPWYKSKGVVGGIGAVGAGAFTAYNAWLGHDMNGVMTGMTAAFGGLMAVIGRMQATTTIGKPVAPVAK
jgi:hypothetical protein